MKPQDARDMPVSGPHPDKPDRSNQDPPKEHDGLAAVLALPDTMILLIADCYDE
jgi:hypothetical protein